MVSGIIIEVTSVVLWGSTCGAELHNLAPPRDGVVPVQPLGGRLGGDGVFRARTQEPMASHSHRQGDRLRHQLRRHVLRDQEGGFQFQDFLQPPVTSRGPCRTDLVFELVAALVLLLVEVNEVVGDPLSAPPLHVPADVERITGDVADPEEPRNRQGVHVPGAAGCGR